jgi:protein-tyrosine-phosphatase
VQLLGRWGEGAINDPYGAARPVYEDCLRRLEDSVNAWIGRLARA